jgi:2-alkyl-3-oxoalkanoate reductase
MKTLVTGAGGFLGLYIVEQLVARGDEVRAFCRGTYPELDKLGVETVRGDIRNREQTIVACQGVDVVFHVAAIAGIGMRWRDFYEINTLGTRHILEGCRKHGVGRLVYTSSPSVTFDGSDQEGVDESEPYPEQFLAHYPHSKSIAEREVLEANGTDGLLTCALRPHLIWGPRDRHLIPRLLDRARSGRLRRVGDGKNLVDMVYVENAAGAHLQAADALSDGSPVAGRAYFLSQGEPVNCWGWINDILALASIPPVEKSISASAAYKLGAVLEGIYRVLRLRGEPPMTRFLATQLSTHHYFDITRAREDFGYSPSVSTEEGMRKLGEELAT